MIYQKIPDLLKIYINICKSAFGINPFSTYSTPRFTKKASLNYTGVKRNYITDDSLRSLVEINMRAGCVSLMGNCYLKGNVTIKLRYWDISN